MKIFGTKITTYIVFQWLAIAVGFLFPLTKKFLPGVLVLAGLVGLFCSKPNWKKWPTIVLSIMMGYYLLHALGMGWTENTRSGQFALEVKASFLAMPLVWMLQREVKNRFRFQVLMAFSYGCLVFFLWRSGDAALKFLDTRDYNVFFYNLWAGDFHPTYIASYYCFAVLFMGWLAFKKVHLFSKKYLHWLVTALFVLSIGILSSKAGYAVILVVLLILGTMWIRKGSLWKGLGILACGLAVLAGSIAISPKSIKRIQEMTNSLDQRASGTVIELVEPMVDEKGKIVKKGSTAGRIIAWTAAWEIIKEEPFGVGTGDGKDELMTSYQEMGAIYNMEHSLNAHNQFLEIGVTLGWPGIILLFSMLICGLIVALRKRDAMFLGFIFVVGINLLFESYLEVQSGITFVAFFFAFFAKSEFQTKIQKRGAKS